MSSAAQHESTSGVFRLLQTFSISQVFASAVILFLVRFLGRAIYRVYFHPLSKFPGPKLRAATRIPGHIEIWKGIKHKNIAALHREYGPVVRINHDELSWTDANAWRDIYGHGTKSNTQGSLPHKAWVKYDTSMNGSSSLLQARDADHTRQRKIFTPAFSDRALKQQEPLFLKYINQLLAKLKEEIEENPERKFDMVKMYNFTTFDVMGDLTFGEPLHMLDNADYDPWVRIIFSNIKVSAKMSIMMNYPNFWRFLKQMLPRSVNKKRLEHFGHSVTRVTKRLEKGRDSEGVDLWDLVLSQKEGKGLSRGEMDSNASLFMLAGTETTATLVSGLTYFLLNNPSTMKKLTDEIRGTFASADDMIMEQLAALPYLAACIKEALRLYPPVPLGLPRMTPEHGSTVCGQFIPPNTVLVIPQYVTYTNEKNFKQPLEFIPERWLGDKRFESDEKHALQPFSIGSRDCLGKNMAYHEMRLIMAKVLYTFDFELAPESQKWGEQSTFILWEKKPLMCKLKVAAK